MRIVPYGGVAEIETRDRVLHELPGRDSCPTQVAPRTHARLKNFTRGSERMTVPVRWDWNDADAAGWVRGLAGFSWRDTLTHLGKVVVAAGAGGSASFDLDEFNVTAFAD